MNANTLYYNMPSSGSSASSASSTDKSIALLIKKAMAKLPMSHNTKKSVDEYYKNAMKEIVLKIKATEKAKKDALKAKEKAVKTAKAKVVAKTTKKTKKHVGGGNAELIERLKADNLQKFQNADNGIKSDDIEMFRTNIKGIISNIVVLKVNNIYRDIDTRYIQSIKDEVIKCKTYDEAIEIMRLISDIILDE
jgi:hypothetical protein